MEEQTAGKKQSNLDQIKENQMKKVLSAVSIILIVALMQGAGLAYIVRICCEPGETFVYLLIRKQSRADNPLPKIDRWARQHKRHARSSRLPAK